MKSYNHLWEQFIADENIDLAIKNASRGKRNRRSVRVRLENPNFKNEIKAYANNFHNHKHKPKQIYDGIQRKKRTIIVPSFDEQVIHHMAVNVLKPIFLKSMYYHSYGSIPNRGGHKGKRAIEKFIRKHPKDCKYVLKMDVRKYFDSIPHTLMLIKLRKLIHDKRFLAVIEEILSVIPHGIPLGFYTSQWLANWYLQGLDHYIKEELHAVFYIRYMDDMVIFGGSKKTLHKIRVLVEQYLHTLGLELKDNWQVFRFEYRGKYRFLDFMGFRFYRNRTTLRRSIMLKMTRKARRVWREEKLTIHSARQMLSYLGWLDCTNTYNMYLEWIKPIICFQTLKRKIRRFDKNRRVKNGMVQCRINCNAA